MGKSKKSSALTHAVPRASIENGNYHHARTLLQDVLNSSESSNAEKDSARGLLNIIRIDRVTLYSGLACFLLYATAIFVGYLKQP